MACGFKIGIDSYGIAPLGLEPEAVLDWARANGADGVQFSGLDPETAGAMDGARLRDLGRSAAAEGLYLEWGGARHIPREMTGWAKKDLRALNEKAAADARAVGASVVRSCSGGLMRWSDEGPPTETLLRETAACLRDQAAMFRDNGVVLAVETHFEFTTFELVRLFEMCEAEPGDWLGVCLDTMNLLTMLEDPICAARRVLPWVVATHVKDGAVLTTPSGMYTFPAPVGGGVVDLAGILRLLATLSRPVHLSIEDHGGEFFLPVFDPLFLAKFPDLTAAELARLVRIAQATEELAVKGTWAPTRREQWPEICEARVKEDLVKLRRLAEEL